MNIPYLLFNADFAPFLETNKSSVHSASVSASKTAKTRLVRTVTGPARTYFQYDKPKHGRFHNAEGLPWSMMKTYKIKALLFRFSFYRFSVYQWKCLNIFLTRSVYNILRGQCLFGFHRHNLPFKSILYYFIIKYRGMQYYTNRWSL